MPERLTHRARALLQDRTVRQVGTVLVLGISLLFLLRAIRNVNLDVMLNAIDAGDVALLVVCGIAYAALLTLLARGWSISVLATG